MNNKQQINTYAASTNSKPTLASHHTGTQLNTSQSRFALSVIDCDSKMLGNSPGLSLATLAISAMLLAGCDSGAPVGIDSANTAAASPTDLAFTPIGRADEAGLADSNDVSWTGLVDSNWNVAGNWITGEVPGTSAVETVNLDKARASVAVPYEAVVDNLYSLDMSNDASLKISATMSPFNDISLGSYNRSGGAHVRQMPSMLTGSVTVKNDLRIGHRSQATSESDYTVSGGSLIVEDRLYVSKGQFIVDGPDGAILTKNMTIRGIGSLSFDFDIDGVSTIVVSNKFVVRAGAKLEIDLRGYVSGGNIIELVKFGSMIGSFNPEDITILGLSGATVSADADSLNVTIIDDVVPQANTLWFLSTGGSGSESLDLQVNTGRRLRDLSSPSLSYTQRADGLDLISSVSWSGSDFDGDGSNDTVTFDIRAEGFSESSYEYIADSGESSLFALGAPTAVVSAQSMWGVDTDAALAAGESLRMTVENVNFSTDSGNLEGFVGFQTAEPAGGNSHAFIIGEGEVLDSVISSRESEDFHISARNSFVVTSAGSGGRDAALGNVVIQFSVSESINSLATDSNDYSNAPIGTLIRSDYPAETQFINYPEFSWDTVQRWASMNIREGGLTTEQAERMAKNHQVISLGSDISNDNRDEGNLFSAELLKSFNPDIKTLFYRNSEIHFSGYAADELFDENEWTDFTLDENGDRVYEGIRAFPSYNESHPEMRQWWVDVAVNITNNPLIDGIFIDKAHDQGFALINEDGQAEPKNDRVQMYYDLSQQLSEGTLVIGNTLRNDRPGGSRELMHIFQGSYVERWALPESESSVIQSEADARVVSIQMMREAALKGKILMPALGDRLVNSYISDQIDAGNIDELIEVIQQGVVRPLAYYLIVAEKYSYFRYQPDQKMTLPVYITDPTDYVEELTRPLGPPLGPPVKNGYIYTRSFEHVDVWLNVETDEAVLTWR